MPEQNLAMIYKPTLGERVWRAMGYGRRPAVPLPDGFQEAHWPGWMKSVVRVNLSFGDRLRLLLTGKLKLESTHYLSAPVDKAITTTNLIVVAPFERQI